MRIGAIDLFAGLDSLTAWPIAAGIAAGVASWLGFGRNPGSHVQPVSRSSLIALTAISVGLVGWRLWPISGERVALGIIAAMALLPVAGLVRQRRRFARAVVVADVVVEVTEAIASELAAGLPPGQALARAGESWPALATVVEAERLGADVPAAWRSLAEMEGGEELRLVGASWEVAARTGGGLAAAMTRVAEGVRANRVTARIVAAELASARATARLVSVLPIAALVMGTSEDAQPIAFLLGEPVGLACLAAGLTCGLAGLWWIEAIAAGVRR